MLETALVLIDEFRRSARAGRPASATGSRASRLLGAAAALALSAGLSAAPAAAQSSDPAAQAEEHWGMLETYCTECHNFEDWAGGIAFDVMSPDGVPEEAETWETALQRLRGNLMPPPGAEQPPLEQSRAFVDWMENYLDSAAPEHNAGYVPIQRLNRTQFAIAVKELLGVEIDPAQVLPTEIEVEGFDNIASALGTSPAFLDQYISAARLAAALAVGEAEPKEASVFYPTMSGNQGGHLPGMPLGTRGGMKFTHVFPADGEYHFNILDVDAGLYPNAMQTRSTLVFLVDGEEVYRTDIGGEEDLALVDREGPGGREKILSKVTEITAQIPQGEHEIAATFIERARSRSDEAAGGRGWGAEPRVLNGIEVKGPFNPTGLSMSQSREKIFVCYPEAESEERACAEDIARHLASQAYRRPVTQDDVDVLMPFFEEGRSLPGGFDKGVEHLVAAVLASPDFLYRTITPDPDQDEPVYALDDQELATRLAFFLWSQGPDQELIELAAEGDLTKGDTLDEQIERMLADPRAETLVDNFALAWLNLDELDAVEPDSARYFGFSDTLRQDFSTELELFLKSVMLEDESIMRILDADHTYLNERLARHYGIEDVYGQQFRKVALENEARHGILGKAAFQLRTSYGDRTSPVLRGAWVLERLMGTPPTPPPPNVETDLSQNEGERPVTLRARLEQHRADPNCNSCHGVIDPIGLALENFDVTGEWRDTDRFAGQAIINASTVMPNGVAIDGPVELRKELMRDPELFAQAISERLLMYAVGRELEYHDMPEVREVVRKAAEDDYRLSAIVKAIAETDAFRLQARPEQTAEAEGETEEAALEAGEIQEAALRQ